MNDRHLAESHGVLVLDESGPLKKGDKRAGTKRHYPRTAGRIEHCQVEVFFAYVAEGSYAFIDRELYLPSEWAEDATSVLASHVPEEVVFCIQPEIARRMLARAFMAVCRVPK